MLNRLKELFSPDIQPSLNADKIATDFEQIASTFLGDNLHGVFQYGSTVYGKPKKESDIDLMVVTKTPTAESIKAVKASLLEEAQIKGLPVYKLHITVVTQDEFSQYPPIHPAIQAALMRGKLVKTSKGKE